MDDADKSLEAYDELFQSIPSIGFFSRKKRIIAYLKVSKRIQQMVDVQQISEENALYLLSVLVRKCPRFQKAAMTTAINLADIDRKLIRPVGFKLVNDMRCNMHLYPVDDISSNSNSDHL